MQLEVRGGKKHLTGSTGGVRWSCFPIQFSGLAKVYPGC